MTCMAMSTCPGVVQGPPLWRGMLPRPTPIPGVLGKTPPVTPAEGAESSGLSHLGKVGSVSVMGASVACPINRHLPRSGGLCAAAHLAVRHLRHSCTQLRGAVMTHACASAVTQVRGPDRWELFQALAALAQLCVLGASSAPG